MAFFLKKKHFYYQKWFSSVLKMILKVRKWFHKSTKIISSEMIFEVFLWRFLHCIYSWWKKNISTGNYNFRKWMEIIFSTEIPHNLPIIDTGKLFVKTFDVFTALSSGAPAPDAWERMRLVCNISKLCWSMLLLTREPKPVLIP